jgi:tetratricopeptide (TPR) repeat protein
MRNSAKALIHYYFSQVLTRIHRDDRAIVELERAVAIDGACVRAWRSLGFMLANRNFGTRALEAMQRALALEDDPVTRFNLGYLYHQLGRRAEAIAEFERVVKASPRNDRAWYGLGVCHQELGSFDKSTAPLQEAAKLQYFNPHAGYHLALAWYKLGNEANCRKEFDRVRSFDPKMAERMAIEFHIR